MKKTQKNNVLVFVQLALLTAIEILFAFTPLGYLKITPAIGATLAHIPVIIAATVLGKWAGLYMGSLFGVLSFITFTFLYPADPMAPAFTPFAENAILGKSWLSLIVVFLPRILLGIFTALIYEGLEKLFKNKGTPVAATLAAIIGTALHTLMVLSLIYFIFGSVYNTDGSKYINFVIAWAGLNCLCEMAVAAIVSGSLIIPLKKISKV